MTDTTFSKQALLLEATRAAAASNDFDYTTAQTNVGTVKFQITGLGEVVSATCSQGGRLHSYGRRPRCAAEDAGV